MLFSVILCYIRLRCVNFLEIFRFRRDLEDTEEGKEELVGVGIMDVEDAGINWIIILSYVD